MSPMLEILIAQTARSDLLSIAAELSVMEKQVIAARLPACLLYTSDAADE